MSLTIVVGLLRGDEGKGKVVDYLSPEFDLVARFNGGSNAGHTVITDEGIELALHQIPSGIARPNVLNVVGSGCFVDPVKLNAEIESVEQSGITVSEDKLVVSGLAHIILPTHVSDDTVRESGEDRQGSTGQLALLK